MQKNSISRYLGPLFSFAHVFSHLSIITLCSLFSHTSIARMFLATILVFLIVFLTTAYWYLKRTTNHRRKKLPGLKPQWIFGNLRNAGLVSGRQSLYEVFAEFKQKYGDVFSFWFGPYHGIVLSRVDHVQHVLSNRHIYDMSERTTRNFRVLFPTGLITLRGNDWKRHARFMLPMFKRAKILPYLDTIITCTDRFINERFVQRDGEIHADLVEQCQQHLLRIIAFIAFDYDLAASTQIDGHSDLRQAFNDFVYCANRFVLRSGLPLWITKIMLAVNWKFQRALNTMRHYVMNIIVQEKNRQKDEFVLSNKPKNLIASLTKGESSPGEVSLSPNEVFDEVSLSILAGFETTATALSWFIFYMSKYSSIQQKIKDELKKHSLTPDTPLTQNILDSLTYVECVTKEVLRFAPIAVATARQAMCDDTIDNIQVKKGDLIYIAIQNLHRDPRYWKIDPTQFVPERFLNEDRNPPQHAYMPFGGGHRACAGQELAFFELKTIIARLMQRVTFQDPGRDADNSGGYVTRITCFPKYLAVRVYMD